MFAHLNNYPDHLTVAEVKNLLEQNEEKERQKNEEYIQFLRSYEGKYVFCQHNRVYGFVSCLPKDWWFKRCHVISLTPDRLYEDDRPINPLWVKSDKPNSIDILKVIDKETYETVETALKEQSKIAYRVHQTLFKL